MNCRRFSTLHMMHANREFIKVWEDDILKSDKINFYLDMAQDMSEKGTCSRHNCGAVIVSDDRVIAVGYSNILPKGKEQYVSDKNIYQKCRFQEEEFLRNSECSEGCRVAHAETTAISNAPNELLLGSTIYLFGKDRRLGEIIYNVKPCATCLHKIIKSGIAWVVSRVSPTDYKSVYVGVDKNFNK